MTDECDIAIVGAGAAGLAAGIFAGEAAHAASRKLSIVLLDGAKSIGAKILVSGGGRCNVTHEQITISDFNGSRNIVRNILAAFDEQATVRWFESMGVKLKREETGKLFPITDSAKTVLNALLHRCDELGIQILSQHRVLNITPSPDRSISPLPHSPTSPSAVPPPAFIIHHEHGELLAHRVILATGGRSLPKTGSDGFGYQIARRLGHTVTDTHPALVPLVLEEAFFHAELSGVSHIAEVSTFSNGTLIDRRTGSLLWTHFGISGPVVMDASRHWVITHAQGGQVEMRCNFIPGAEFDRLEKYLVDLASRQPRKPVASVFGGPPDRAEPPIPRLPDRLAAALLRHAGIEPSLTLPQLPRECRRNLVHTLTSLLLPVIRDRGWNYAEVTAGGVPLAEIDYRTMQSRRTPGVYLIGEILDCDGRIGGFNFQWAWATGSLAGRAAVSMGAG